MVVFAFLSKRTVGNVGREPYYKAYIGQYVGNISETTARLLSQGYLHLSFNCSYA